MDLSTFSTVFFSAAEKKINLNCQNEQHHSTLKCWQLTFTQFLSPKYCFPSKPLTLVQRYATFLPLCEFFPRSAGPEVTPRPNSPCTPQGLSPAYPDPQPISISSSPSKANTLHPQSWPHQLGPQPEPCPSPLSMRLPPCCSWWGVEKNWAANPAVPWVLHTVPQTQRFASPHASFTVVIFHYHQKNTINTSFN